MANVDVAQFEFTTNTATGDQTIATGLGFTPKGYIIWSSLTTADATYQDHYGLFIGFSDGTTTRCCSNTSQDATANSTADSMWNNDFRFGTPSASSTTADGIASHSSFGSGTIVINWSDAPSAAYKMYGLAFGGTTFECSVEGFTGGTISNGNRSFTTTITDPTCGFFIHPQVTTNAATATAAGGVGFGIAVSSSKRGCISNVHEDARTAADAWQVFDDTRFMWGMSPTTGAQGFIADFVSWDATGFTLNWVDAPASTTQPFFAFLMKGANFDMGTVAKRTSTGDTTVTPSSVGTVKGIMLFANNETVASSIGSTPRTAIGGASSTSLQGGTFGSDVDAADPMVTIRRSEDSNIFIMAQANATAASSTTMAIANISAIGTNTFTLTYTTADATAGSIIWWVIGEVEGGVEEAPEQIAIQSYGNIHENFDSNKNAIFG